MNDWGNPLGLVLCWQVILVMISMWVVATHEFSFLTAISIRSMSDLVIPHPSEREGNVL